MSTIVLEDELVHIPAWVADLDSFRRWADSEEFPDTGRICYLQGEVWVDMSREQIFTHNQVKAKYHIVLGSLADREQLGLFFPDGVRLSNVAADLCCVPDGCFVSTESLEKRKVRLVEGAEEGYVELEGSPDMVLEVMSRSSAHKDTVVLRQLYWEAGVREYWLVDARRTPLRFDILRHTTKGYVATRKQDGWVRSVVLGKSFKLSQRMNKLGYPEYSLAVR